MKFQMAWKIYFWSSLVLIVGGWTSDALGIEGLLITDDLAMSAVGFVIDAITLIGLYAFAYQVALGKRVFWASFFFVSLGYLVWVSAQLLVSGPSEVAPSIFWIALYVLMVVLLVPQFAALFLYAFRSPRLWALSSSPRTAPA